MISMSIITIMTGFYAMNLRNGLPQPVGYQHSTGMLYIVSTLLHSSHGSSATKAFAARGCNKTSLFPDFCQFGIGIHAYGALLVFTHHLEHTFDG